MTAGAVGAVLVPGRPDSGGAQFFVCASDQLALQGQYTVFGRVVDGLEVVQADLSRSRPTPRIGRPIASSSSPSRFATRRRR